MSFNQINK